MTGKVVAIVLAMAGSAAVAVAVVLFVVNPIPGGKGSSGSSSASSSSVASASGSQLTTWCTLTIGEPKAAVDAAMGSADGHAADAFRNLLTAGQAQEEWDVGTTIMLATFTGGKASNLQAYQDAVGPVGASNISCPPFRSQSHPNG